jgi:hypothetical protein
MYLYRLSFECTRCLFLILQLFLFPLRSASSKEMLLFLHWFSNFFRVHFYRDENNETKNILQKQLTR